MCVYVSVCVCVCVCVCVHVCVCHHVYVSPFVCHRLSVLGITLVLKISSFYCVLSVILIIITLLMVSVTSQVIEFDPSLNETIYIEVRTYVVTFIFHIPY